MERGLSSRKDFIPWDMIRELKYPALVIGGYGAITINYIGSGGMKRSIAIKASASEEYLSFLRYLIQRSHKATIDPGLVKALDYSPGDAKADLASCLLLIVGIVLLFIVPIIIFYYSTGISAGYLSVLFFFPFSVVPLALTMKGLMRRFQGETPIRSRRMLWPILTVCGPLAATVLFFVFSPFSFYWLTGDIAMKFGNLSLAERYYQASLKRVPGNIDVLYELGKLYLKEEKYEQALPYLQQAYIKDPTWWGPQAVILVPDTLMKLKKHDEALKWCERVLKDRPNKIDITRAISKKQDEIISEKSYYERQSISREAGLAALSRTVSPETPSGTQQFPQTEAVPKKEDNIAETQKTPPPAAAQSPLMFPESSPSKRCSLAASSGIIRFLSGDYTGNKTIDLSIQIIFFIYFSVCLFFIAKKLHITAPWTAFVPVVNLWTLVTAAGKPWWWILLLIIPIANIFVWISLWMSISENIGKNKWLGLLVLVPFVSFIFMGVLAFSGTERMQAPAPA